LRGRPADRQAYETLLYILTPFVLPISFLTAPLFSTYMFFGTLGMYLINTVIFNELHLRLKKECVSRRVIFFYYVRSSFGPLPALGEVAESD
jgi:hypothetical protein